MRRHLSAVLAGLVLLCLPGRADDTALDSTMTGKEYGSAQTASGLSRAESDPDAPGKWFLLMGATNLHTRLDDSEAEIDRLLNNGLGRLFPRWKEPTTFADWRNDMRLWDMQVGVGRELGDRYAWFLVTGYTSGTVKNDQNLFLFGLPVKVRTRFKRSVWFLSTGLDWYPWGKPDFEDAGLRMPVTDRFRASRPFLQCATGYVSIHSTGTVNLERPFIGETLGYRKRTCYDEYFISPRVGLEVPLDPKTSFSLMAGYNFFTPHHTEFGGSALHFVLKRRF